jgi:broad specificity phosphatase PhoE
MSRVFLLHPGCTEFDQQGRIKGSLDLPLCAEGEAEARCAVGQLLDLLPESFEIHTAPCEAAVQTANLLASARKLKAQVVKTLGNMNHGLWHGKLISELKQTQPKLYRQCQDSPDVFCAPQGEPLVAARKRVEREIGKLLKKSKEVDVVFVLPDPLGTIAGSWLSGQPIDDIWQAETDHARWECYERPASPGQPAKLLMSSVAAANDKPATSPQSEYASRPKQVALG